MGSTGQAPQGIRDVRERISEFAKTWFFSRFLSPVEEYDDLELAYILTVFGGEDLALELLDAVDTAVSNGELLLENVDPDGVRGVRCLALAVAGARLEEAIRMACEVLKKSPNQLAARHGLAYALLKDGRTAEARDQFDWLVSQRPDDAALLTHAAKTYRILAVDALKAGAPLETVESLCLRALALYSGNGCVDYMQTFAANDEEVDWVLKVWGQAAYRTAVASGSIDRALSILHSAERKMPAASAVVACGLAEAYVDKARRTGDPGAAEAARRYIDHLRQDRAFEDPTQLDRMLAMLP